MKRRLGKVTASKYLLEGRPGFIEKYLPDFQIIMTRNIDEYTIEYTGIHPEFDETEANLMDAPEYSFVWRMLDNNKIIREIMK